MGTLIGKTEVPLARKAVEKAGLYLVPRNQLEKIAEVAADAYSEYPLHKWFTNGKYDFEVSARIMEISLKTMIEEAVIYADSEELNGFAVWLPIGFKGNKTIPFLANGGLKLIFKNGIDMAGRLISYEKYAMELKKEFVDNVGWYIYNLSIKKDAQGKGIASKLLRPMLEFCDRKKMVSYLETNKQSNVGIYEHFGFEVAKQGVVPKSDVSHYSMIRMPKQ